MSKHTSERYASPARTAEYLGASVSTIVRLEKKGVLHPTRLGRRVYFDLAEVDEVMAAKRAGKERSGGSQVLARASGQREG